ncbi:MAG: Stf0 family sulfotransferase [Bryobacteraceae bacterium]|jgi:LPS sulfotransferase NodH
MTPSRGYLLCSVERTGSNLLAQAVAGTGMAGQPVEFFNAVEQEKPWLREILGDSAMVDGLPKLLAAGSTPNGVFGAKVHWNHFRHLGMSVNGEWSEAQRLGPYQLLQSRLPTLLPQAAAHELLQSRFSDLHPQATAYQLLRSLLPDLRIIWLQRRNMVARAISHFRARQSGLWYIPSSSRVPAQQTPEFDLAEIHNLYCLGDFQQQSWRRFFEEYGIQPHCVFYEQLVENYEPTVRNVLSFLGLDGDQTVIPSPISLKQGDALSQAWEEHYRTLKWEAGL